MGPGGGLVSPGCSRKSQRSLEMLICGHQVSPCLARASKASKPLLHHSASWAEWMGRVWRAVQALWGVQRDKEPLQISDLMPPAFVHSLISVLSPGVGSPQPPVPESHVRCCHILWTQGCPALPFLEDGVSPTGILGGEGNSGRVGARW